MSNIIVGTNMYIRIVDKAKYLENEGKGGSQRPVDGKIVTGWKRKRENVFYVCQRQALQIVL